MSALRSLLQHWLVHKHADPASYPTENHHIICTHILLNDRRACKLRILLL